jgi:hypothetical protein
MTGISVETTRVDVVTRRVWNSRQLLREATDNECALNRAAIEPFREFFWADLCAEYDAVNLFSFVQSRKRQYSPRFLRFVDYWYLDERNHAEGFFELNSKLFGRDEDELLDHLRSREPQFQAFEAFLADEFKALVLFAYDEFATIRTYQRDTFYERFGHPAFGAWIRAVLADEGIHFGNAVRLLQTGFAHRLSEVENVLAEISRLEQVPYHNTFLLDHDGPHFLLTEQDLGQGFLDEICAAIRRKV